MAEDTTTDATVETGAETAQPETTGAAEAVETTETKQEGAEVQQAQGEPSEDEQLTKFAQSKGLELDSENAKKAARMAMEAEKNMHKATGRASELERNLNNQSDVVAQEIAEQTGQDPELLKRLQRVEVKDAVRDFWEAHPEAKKHEQKMIEILQTKPHLAGDLESLYANVLMQSGSIDAAKSEGKRDALVSLAHTQQAAVPTGNATTSTMPKDKPFEELSIAEMEAKLGFARR